MLSGWNQLEQNAKEFFLDVHSVTRNFIGEYNWEWIQDQVEINREDEIIRYSPYQRFTQEMMQGAQFYSNESNLEDRIALGACAAIYCIPYAAGRILFYDSVCNVLEYATWRTTEEAYCAIEPKGRRRNGYILGAPLSAVFITPLALSEGAARILGLTEYGGYIIKAAFMQSINMLHRDYTPYGPKDIEEIQNLLTMMPVHSWNYLDRAAYVTLPGLIAGVEMVVGVSCGVIARIGEMAGRILGLTEYGGNIIQAAFMRSINMLHRHYTPYSNKDIAAVEELLIAHPTSNWNYLDRAAYVTLPGLIAGVEMVVGASCGVIARIGEVAGRILGLTEYGGNIIKAAFMRAINMLHRDYTPYSINDIAAIEELLIANPASNWNYLDYAAYVTLPGLIAGVEMAMGTSCGVIARIGEVAGRLIGLSEYGGYIIKAAHMRAVNMLHRDYTPYSINDIAAIEELLIANPASNWNYLDYAAYVTLPGLVAGVEMVVGAVCGITVRIGEAVGRLIGFSEYGGYIIKAAFMRSINMLHRDYTPYSTDEITTVEKLLATAPIDGWHYWDRAAYLTLPALIAGVEIAAGAVCGIIARVGEAVGRIIGLSEYGGYIIQAAHMRAVNMLHRDYTPYSKDEIRAVEKLLTTAPIDGWHYLDRITYVTLPGLIAGVEIAAGAACGIIARAGEAAGRIIGLSEYGGNIIKAAHMRAVNMLHRDYTPYSIEDIAAVEKLLTTAPIDGWHYLDRITYVTLPGLIAGVEISMGVVCGIIARVGEAAGRVLGLTEYGGYIIQAAFMRAVNMLHRDYTPYSDNDIKAVQDYLVKPPATNWNHLDGMAYVTLPGLIAGVTMITGAVCGVIARLGEATGRILGFSQRSAAAISVIFSKCQNMFGITDSPKLHEKIRQLKNPVHSCWDVLDVIGSVLTSLATIAVSIALIPMALLGFSKSNYHRLNYYKHRINNSINIRLGNEVDKTWENHHKNHLKNGETTALGIFFSRFNLLNGIAKGIYIVTRFIAAPIIYATFRGIKQLFGIVPIVKSIYRACCPVHYDLNDPIDKVRKRFADLTKALDEYGRLPLSQNLDNKKVARAIKQAEDRNVFSRMGFSLFSEARKILSLGHSIEERLIAEFRDKFEEFIRVRKNYQTTVNVNQFFTEKIELKNGVRFSYQYMVNHIKKSYSSEKEREKIDKIASLLRNDIEKEMGVIHDERSDESENYLLI